MRKTSKKIVKTKYNDKKITDKSQGYIKSAEPQLVRRGIFTTV